MTELKSTRREQPIETTINSICKELLHLRLPPQILLSILLLATLIVSTDAQAAESDVHVIGGRPVEACEFPHLASVHTFDPVELYTIICSGSVVDVNHDGSIQSVLTAAHCVDSAAEQSSPGLISVRLGHDKLSDDPLLPVSQVSVHPDEDLAVLQLARPIDVDAEKCTQALPIAGSVDENRPATLVGFGTVTEDSTKSARIAHTAEATIISGSNFCTDGFPDMICIGDETSEPSDAIPRLGPGDSGSGLLQENDMGSQTLIGVARSKLLFWAVSLATDVTIPETRTWLLNEINQYDTGRTESIPPTTLTSIEFHARQFFVGHPSTLRLKIFSRQTDRGNDGVVDSITTNVDITTPCLRVVSITDLKGNAIPFSQDDNGVQVTYAASGNRYDDSWIISVLPDESQACVPNIHGVGHAKVRGSVQLSHSWNNDGENLTKQYEQPLDHNIPVHRSLIIHQDLSSEEDTLLHEAAMLNQQIFARRIGDDIRIWGESDIFKSFYIEYEGQFIKIIGYNDPNIHLHFEYAFDTVIPNFFAENDSFYLPLIAQ